jgi:hypothetical protein
MSCRSLRYRLKDFIEVYQSFGLCGSANSAHALRFLRKPIRVHPIASGLDRPGNVCARVRRVCCIRLSLRTRMGDHRQRGSFKRNGCNLILAGSRWGHGRSGARGLVFVLARFLISRLDLASLALCKPSSTSSAGRKIHSKMGVRRNLYRALFWSATCDGPAGGRHFEAFILAVSDCQFHFRIRVVEPSAQRWSARTQVFRVLDR